MAISGIGGFNGVVQATTRTPTRQNIPVVPEENSADVAAAKNKQTVDAFMTYSKKSFAEKFQENWLTRRGMTKDQYDALPPEEKKAIDKQIKEDMEKAIKEEVRKNTLRGTNILV